MEPIEYVRLLRRRWRLLAACLLVAAAAGWLTTPAHPANDQVDYVAQHVLLRDNTSETPAPALAQVALFVRNGEVPKRVAERLKYVGNPGTLAANIDVTVDETAGSLVISATASSPAKAAELANAFAEETLAYFGEQALAAEQTLIQQSNDDVARLQIEVDDIEAQIQVAEATGGFTGVLEAQRDSKIREYAVALDGQTRALGQPPPSAGYLTLDAASADLATPKNGGFSAPQSRPGRLAVALVVGLLLGIGAVLVAERVDPRIHTREGVELAFGLPVVAEVPRVHRRTGHPITSLVEPLSAPAEAYRRARAAILLTPISQLGKSRAHDQDTGGDHLADPHVLLVTSPAPSEGKTTAVANLAAVFAEMGGSVLLLGCDFRRPELHKYFGVADHPGISEVLTGTHQLADVIQPTSIAGVSIAPNGSGLRNLGDLAVAGRSLVESARDLADIVIIDTAPLLATNDAAELVHAVDAVVVLARSGRTTAESASRARVLLDRLSAPVVGVVLIAAPETESTYSSYIVKHPPRRGLRALIAGSASTPAHTPEPERDPAPAPAPEPEPEGVIDRWMQPVLQPRKPTPRPESHGEGSHERTPG